MKETIDFFSNKEKIIYNKEQWKFFENIRDNCKKIMQSLFVNRIECYTYGSIARGDIKKNSDIDIIIPYAISSFKVELSLENAGFRINEKMIVMATPSHTPKAVIGIQSNYALISISFPLIEFQDRDTDFYGFAGRLSYKELVVSKRKPGVNKKLQLISPEEDGHSSQGLGHLNVVEVSKILGTEITIINERIRVLKRRSEKGRTGVFLKRYLDKDEQFETEFKRIVDSNSIVKKLVQKRS